MVGRKAHERMRLERNLAFLGTLGNNAPFIGLFGTVLGIIRSFHDLAGNQAGGVGIVMAGISEALVATAVGLLVAIPAVIGFNFFNRRVRQVLANVDALAHVVLAQLKGEGDPLATATAGDGKKSSAAQKLSEAK
jgi:biopolymer transport protein ExbB